MPENIKLMLAVAAVAAYGSVARSKLKKKNRELAEDFITAVEQREDLIKMNTFLINQIEYLSSMLDTHNVPVTDFDLIAMWRPRWYAILYKQQFRDRYDHPLDVPIRCIGDGEKFSNSLEAARRYGLLEREVVLSVLNKTPTWPTYQYFEMVEMD